MSISRVALLAGLTAVAVLGASGCVTKSAYRESATKTDARMNSTQSAVEANERRIADPAGETDSKLETIEGEVQRAMEVGNNAVNRADQAATMAEKAARGKLLWTVTLSDEKVRFPLNGHTLPDAATAELDRLVEQIMSYGKAVYVEVEGHTDNSGEAQFNYELGEKRAMAVRNYLNRNGGIPLHAMNTISYGESSPEADNTSPEGRARNRRVVIKVLE